MGSKQPRCPPATAPLSFRLAAAVDFGVALKQRLLESVSEVERLELLTTVMRTLIPSLELRKSATRRSAATAKGTRLQVSRTILPWCSPGQRLVCGARLFERERGADDRSHRPVLDHRSHLRADAGHPGPPGVVRAHEQECRIDGERSPIGTATSGRGPCPVPTMRPPLAIAARSASRLALTCSSWTTSTPRSPVSARARPRRPPSCSRSSRLHRARARRRPRARRRSWPMTLAPSALASWTEALPTPPAAPWTSTVSPGCSAPGAPARSTRSRTRGRGPPPRGTTAPAGLGTACASAITAYSA